jgi:hypothetical protein
LILSLFLGYFAIQLKFNSLIKPIEKKIIIHILILISVLMLSLTSLQFTKVAVICILAGFIYLIFEKNKLGLGLGVLFLILGSSIRIESFYLVLLLIFPILIIIYNQKLFYKSNRIFLIVGVLLSFIINQLNNNVYKNDLQWNKYKKLNNLTSKLNDYDNPRFTYNNVKHVLDKADWTKQDYYMISSFYTDFGINKFNYEKLQLIRENTNKLYNLKDPFFLVKNYLEFVINILSQLLYGNYIFVVLIILCFVVLLYFSKHKYFFWSICYLFFIITVLWILSVLFEGNFFKDRIIYAAFLPYVLCLIYLVQKNESFKLKINSKYLFFLCLLVLFFMSFPRKLKESSSSHNAMEYITNSKDELYVFWAEIDNVNVFKIPFNFQNAYFLAWLSGSPYNQKKLDFSSSENKGIYSLRNKDLAWYFVNYDKSLMSYTNGEMRKEKVKKFYLSNFKNCIISEKKIPLNSKDTLVRISFNVQDNN